LGPLTAAALPGAPLRAGFFYAGLHSSMQRALTTRQSCFNV
jgi:hypothetical protein